MTIYNLIENTNSNLSKYNIANAEEVSHLPTMVEYSEEMYNQQRALKKFLMKNMYHHHMLMHLRFKASNIIRSLFNAYVSDSYLLPSSYQAKIDQYGLYQVITDYISGMTDRYAFKQYNRLFTVDLVG